MTENCSVWGELKCCIRVCVCVCAYTLEKNPHKCRNGALTAASQFKWITAIIASNPFGDGHKFLGQIEYDQLDSKDCNVMKWNLHKSISAPI